MSAIPAGFLAAIAAEPWEQTHRLVAADWCQEHGLAFAEQQLRHGPPPLGLVFFGDGDGGYGDGYGDGDGDSDSYGYGYGDGYGDGGYVYVYGDGDGDGDGDGYGGFGDGLLTLEGRTMPDADGKNWLIVLPHGWVICGRVVEQTGPYQFRVEGALVICRTGGTPWDQLADGKGRDGATYRPWGEVRIGPQFVLARPWKGELPQVKA